MAAISDNPKQGRWGAVLAGDVCLRELHLGVRYGEREDLGTELNGIRQGLSDPFHSQADVHKSRHESSYERDPGQTEKNKSEVLEEEEGDIESGI